jgi:hypothetical protein
MNKEILDVNEAYLVLKQGLIVIDYFNNYFKIKNDYVYVKSENANFNLTKEAFIELYKESKFVIYDSNEDAIDELKDKEYYSFKHK